MFKKLPVAGSFAKQSKSCELPRGVGLSSYIPQWVEVG